MSKLKNVLILSGFTIQGGWGGGVIMRSLLKDYEGGFNFFWTTFSTEDNKQLKPYDGVGMLNFQTWYLNGQGRFNFILKLDALLFSLNFKSLLRKHQIDALWIVLGPDYNQLFKLSQLIPRLDLPIHISVHDDPVIEITPVKKEKARQLLSSILNSATSVDVISERMQRAYQQQYGIQAQVVTRGIPPDFPNNNLRALNTVDILMAGNGNASAPWPLPLLKAIEHLNKTQPAILHLFDSKFKKCENNMIKAYDQIDESIFNSFLSKIHLGYACDDLEPERIAFAQLSLPTKIITYIGAGIPFVYHGPSDSTVGDLLKKYKAGIVVDSNDPIQLSDSFLYLLNHYDSFQEECKRAVRETFSQSKIQQSFYEHFLRG